MDSHTYRVLSIEIENGKSLIELTSTRRFTAQFQWHKCSLFHSDWRTNLILTK
jgi:hypothetical protein